MEPASTFEIRNPDFSFLPVKAMLFDLDDTLYFIPSGAQFIRYGEHLAEFLPPDERRIYLQELKTAWDDDSPLRIGRAYDPKTGWILEFNDDWQFKTAHTLTGKPVSPEEFAPHYPEGVKAKALDGLTHLASGWAIPTALARIRGLQREHYRKAYLATRAEMARHPEIFPLIAPKNISEFFSKLSEKKFKLFVATNSDFTDAMDVLNKLKIDSYFDKVYGEAKKPANSLSLLKEALATYQLAPNELTVIGDSVYNDLHDAKLLGCQTVLIERYAGQPLGFVDVRVWDFEGFMRLLNF